MLFKKESTHEQISAYDKGPIDQTRISIISNTQVSRALLAHDYCGLSPIVEKHANLSCQYGQNAT